MREAWEVDDSLNGWDFWLASMKTIEGKIMTKTARCKTCRYIEEGICHRFPNKVAKLDNDWCGEWKPLPGYGVQGESPNPNPPTSKDKSASNSS